MSDEQPALVNSATAAKRLGVSGTTLRRWIEWGIVTPASTTAGGHARWNLEQLQAQIDEHQRKRHAEWRAKQQGDEPAPAQPPVPPLEQLLGPKRLGDK